MDKYQPLKWPVDPQKSDIKKAAPQSGEAVNENLQPHCTTVNKFGQGYQDATTTYDWTSMPIERVFRLINNFRLRALLKGNMYFAGFAKGALDAVRERVVIA